MGETFKQRMKRLRLRAGFKSAADAAEAIGCTRVAVDMWETPASSVKSVGGKYLLKVARAYRVRPDYINTGRGDDGYPWAEAAAPTPVAPDAALTADEAIKRLQNDVRALNMVLGVLVGVMTHHRPAEASDVRGGLQAQAPEHYRAYGLVDELLTTLGVSADEAKPAKARA